MNFGTGEILLVLAIVIVIFGVGKIADVGPALGKAISGFRKAIKEPDEEDEPKKDEAEEQK